MNIIPLKNFNSPKFIFTLNAFLQLQGMMNTTHAKIKEFGFLGEIKRENNLFIVEEFHLVPQEKCSAAYWETDDARYPEWLAQTFPRPEQRNKLRLHGHSHVNMPTGPSGTDNTQIQALCDRVSDFYIQLIVNHNMENTINIWDKQTGLIYEKVPQFIQFNNHYLELTSKNKVTPTQVTLPKNTELIVDEDSYVSFGEGLFFDFKTLTYLLIDDDIVFKNGSFTLLKILDYEPDFKELIKPIVYSGYPYESGNALYNTRTNEFEYEYSPPAIAPTKQQERGRNGSKQTHRLF